MKLKSPEKEELIYQTVLEITLEKGLSGLKVADIARQAGLAHGTVYIYFKNKKELINSLYQKAKRSAAFMPASLDGEFRETLEYIWKNYLLYLVHRQKEIHFMQQCLQSSFLEADSLKLSVDFTQKLYGFFESGKEKKYLKALDNELIVSLITGLGKEIAAKINNGTLQMTDELVEESFEICWSAIRR